MEKLLVQLSLLACLLACTKEKAADEIIIEGNVRNMPDGKVYLTEGHDWKILLDSTESKNGHFAFKIKPDSSFTPYMASIIYPDSTSPIKFTSLGYSNDFVLPSDTTVFYNYSYGAFYLEKGTTTITDRKRVKKIFKEFIPVSIKAGKETEVMYRNQFTDFGWLGNLDASKRTARVNFFKNEIKKYPFSYYLIKEIYNAKDQYSEQELKDILGLFNQDVQASAFGRKVSQYLVNRIDPDQPYPNIFLTRSDNQQGGMIDNGAKVNMLVFWASWCGPCRQEIPQLKQLYAEYKNRGVNLVSVSLDEKPESWQKALSQEQMGWQQLIVDKEQIELMKQKFHFSAIPLVILADSRGKEIKRFVGYEKDNVQLYKTVLEEKLKGK